MGNIPEHITPSQILDLVVEKSLFGRALAIEGTKAHRQLVSEAKTFGANILPGLRNHFSADDEQIVSPEVEKKAILSEGLHLLTKIDVLVAQTTVVELKPSPQKRHFAQLVMECYAASECFSMPIHGVLSCYKNEKAYILDDGGSSLASELILVCQLAHSLRKYQNEWQAVKTNSKLSKKSVNHQIIMPGFNTVPTSANDRNKIGQMIQAQSETLLNKFQTFADHASRQAHRL